ncbi:MAG: hypothetical protein QNJ72_03495 [Pleurocapsa sp. MO_226.B13]|nr:hypothetical protein [Pleurocapsa sp. MO_226.B13]
MANFVNRSVLNVPLPQDLKRLVRKQAEANLMSMADYTRNALRTQIRKDREQNTNLIIGVR